MARRKLLEIVFLLIFVKHVIGHGMMLDPPNRSSLWRFDDSYPVNWNDNQNFCGGFYAQYYLNDGKCGVCGDNYADPRPRANENTGTYGTGVIMGTYAAGSLINVSITLTANHLGSFRYSLCVLEDDTQPEPEDCFQDLLLADGSTSFPITRDDFEVVNEVMLPEGLTCDHCVLRWSYRCGNSWGDCGNGTGAVGCGNQEYFMSCADITIY